jgi:glutamyl/glutaminyl-tRNA synthetase
MSQSWDSIVAQPAEEPIEVDTEEEIEEEPEDDEAVPEESEDEETDDAETEEEESAEEKKEASYKVYRAKTPEGESLKVTDDTKLKIKVNGSFKWITVKDLASEYNGQTVYKERFEELKTREKAINEKSTKDSASSERVKGLVDGMVSAFSKEAYDDALLAISEITQQDPVRFSTVLVNGMHKLLVQLGDMTPEGRQAWQMALENKALKKGTEKKEKETSKQSFIAEQNRLLQEYRDVFQFRDEELREAAKHLVEVEKVEKEKVTANMLANSALNSRISNNIDSAAEDMQITLDSPTKMYIASLVRDKELSSGSSLSVSDYEDIIQNHVRIERLKKAESNLSRKVANSTTPKRPSKPVKKQEAATNLSLADRWAAL